MGAITFSLDSRLASFLTKNLKLSSFVETGTFKGDTVAAILHDFRKIVSVELSQELWADAARRFESYPNVRILQGDSVARLHELKNELQGAGVLYWLDAHWCVATDTAGEQSQCPLLGELAAIATLNTDSVVLIDDARLFLAPPLAPHEITHWPTFNQITQSLHALSSEHEIMVLNDVIVFFPSVIKVKLQQFAQIVGFDWLVAANSLKENWYSHMVEKETFIQKQAEELSALSEELEANKLLARQQANTIKTFQLAYDGYSPILMIACFLRRAKNIFRPRLGNLNQYAPRPLTIAKKVQLKPQVNYPRISIVTPSFEQGMFIERTLLSVFQQQYDNLEFFVQDGGSTDGTVDVLKRYEHQLSGWVSEKDNGQSQAINRGFSKTNGDIMAWLNSDDLLLPDALNIVADYFNRHPEIDVVYGNRLLIDENDQEIGRWILPGHYSHVLSWADYIPQETMFWRRRIWDKVGGQIDESFYFAMDWDLLVRFRDAGASFAHIPQYLGAFRIHEKQKTSASINDIGYKEMDRIRERVIGRVPSPEEIKKSVLPFLLKHIAIDIFYRISFRIKNLNKSKHTT